MTLVKPDEFNTLSIRNPLTVVLIRVETWIVRTHNKEAVCHFASMCPSNFCRTQELKRLFELKTHAWRLLDGFLNGLIE